MALPLASVPLTRAEPSDRVDYLKKVAALTFLGLIVSALAGTLSALFIAPYLSGRWTSLAVILGSWGVANYVAPRFVFGEQKMFGYFLASIFQGVAMGYLLLMAVIVSAASLGNPFLLIGEALALTALAALGMAGYVWSSPKDFSMIGAAMSMLTLPMLVLMGISFVFPIGGPLGIALAAVFVVVSAVGLLYQVNKVLHELATDMHVEGAYLITMGVLILFWNILSLLLRLTSRD